MRKLLRPQDILLLGLGGIIDVIEEVKDPLGIMARSYETMYGFTPQKYKRHNYAHLVWRSLKTGYIEKVVKDGEVYLHLTHYGKKRVSRDFPLIKFQNVKWDGIWRIAIFDIAELNRNTRDRLREKLKELGFGMFQQSVYLSPHNLAKDLAEFIETLGLSEFVYVFEIPRTQISVGDSKALANKVWKLDELNEKYIGLIEKIENSHLIASHGRGKQLNALVDISRQESRQESEQNSGQNLGREELIKSIREEYLNLILRDPFLPKDLLPSNWAIWKLRELVGKLKI